MPGILSTAEARRDVVISRAITEFARTGFLGTPISAVAGAAKISTAYVFKLFPSKESLFVAALDTCYERVEQALSEGAETAADGSPESILDAMGEAYADLIADRDLLMLQVHAQAATSVPEIGAAVRRGLRRITEFALERSGAPEPAVQRFVAYGQLCHLIVTAGVEESSGRWASAITEGIRHPESR
jgi:AcrR family transcriptional regulator